MMRDLTDKRKPQCYSLLPEKHIADLGYDAELLLHPQCPNEAKYLVQDSQGPHRNFMDERQACRRHLASTVDSFNGRDVIVIPLRSARRR
jgi:hypothetical protein